MLNMGKVIEREILLCARRNEGRLFYPNLVWLLCDAANVPQFDHEEEEFALDPEVMLTFDEEVQEGQNKKKEEKKKEQEPVEEKTVGEGPQLNKVLLLLQEHILKQEAVWVFVKAAHEWYTLGFGETILPPPVFPDWVLPDVVPSGHAHEKPNATTSNTPAPKKRKADEKDAAASDGVAKSTTASEKTIMLDNDEDDIPIPSEQQGSAEKVADNEEFQFAHASDNA